MRHIVLILKYCTIAIVLIGVLLIGSKVSHDIEGIRLWILSFGIFSPVLYVLLCSLRPLILFPFLILTVAGGLAFGAVLGTALTVIGGSIGATFSYRIARKYGDFLKIEKRKGLRTLERKIEESGFHYVLILRIVPLLNFDLVSYASGLSTVRFKPYFVATILGMLPGTIGLNYIGSSLITADFKQMIIIGSILLCLVLLSLLVKKYIQRKIG